jgi:hypothetical protein
MSWAENLTREELIDHLDVYRDHPEFLHARDAYLKRAVIAKDVELADLLLKAGANPDWAELGGDSLLLYLVHEYEATHTSQGPLVLRLATLLLSYGANPERVESGNWRAIDHCIDHGLEEMVNIFVRYGADPKPRPYV